MEIGSVGVVTFLAKEPGAPAVAAPHIQNLARRLGRMFEDKVDISAVVLCRLVGAVSERSPNVLGRSSVKELDAREIHGLRSKPLDSSRAKDLNGAGQSKIPLVKASGVAAKF